MPIAIIGGIIAGAGAIGGAAIASHGANQAASTQAQAANQAAQLQHEDAQQALQFQEQQYANQQKELAPYYTEGVGALANLSNLLGIPVSGNLVDPASMTAIGSTPGKVIPNTPFSPLMGQKGFQNVPTDGSGVARPEVGTARIPSQLVPGGTASIGTGPTSLQSLINPSLGAKGSLSQGWNQTFTAPDALTEQNDPGYQARLKLGEQALNNSAAAKGNLLTGGTARDVNQFAQDYASNEYQNVYNRAYNNYATQYNAFENNQTNLYNRLASLAGVGQQTASQLGLMGQNAANGVSNILLTSGGQIGNDLQNAGAARASGYVGSANAYSGALNGLGNLASLYALLQGQNQFGGLSPATFAGGIPG